MAFEVTFQASQDAYFNDSSPNSNFGSSTILAFGRSGTTNYRTAIEFDISSLPSGAVVHYAYLNLYNASVSSAGETAEVRRITESWTEGSVTWNSWSAAGGVYTEELGIDFAMATATGYMTIPITTLVHDAFANRAGSVNLLLKAQTESGGTHYNFPRSKDHGTASQRPTLVVEYSLSPYVELREDVTFQNSTSATWEAINIVDNYSIPDGSVLEIVMSNTDQNNENEAGVRTSGSSVSRLFDIHESEGGGVDTAVAHVKMSSSGIETYAENAGDVDFTIVGYWVSGSCDFVEINQTLVVNTNATWETVDLSSAGVQDGDIVELHIWNSNASAPLTGGCREVGSTLDRRLDLQEAESGGRDWLTMLVKASGSNGSIQIWLENDSRIRATAYGYFPAESLPGEWTERFETINEPVFAGFWTQVTETDLPNPDPLESGVTMYSVLSNDSTITPLAVGNRDPNSSHDRFFDLHEAENGGADFVSMHVHISGQQYDSYSDSATNTTNRMLGYWLTPKPSSVASGTINLFIHGHDDTSPKLYWITDDSDIIGQARLDGSNSGVLASFSSFAQPGKLENDKDPKRPVYYILTTDEDVFEIDDDGNTTALYSNNLSDTGIEVDHSRNLIFFADDALVTSGALDGSASGTFFDDSTPFSDFIYSMWIDHINGHFYYLINDFFNSAQRLYRRDYPSSDNKTLIHTVQDLSEAPQDFVISVSDGKIYVLTTDSGPVYRITEMNLDGSSASTLVTSPTNNNGRGVGIHPQSRSIFVANQSSNQIDRVDMDTGDITVVLDDAAAGTDDPRDVLVQPDWAISLFIKGKEVASGTCDLFLHGCDTVSGQLDCTVTGHTPASGDIDLYIHGASGVSGDIPCFLHGCDTISGSIPCFIEGAAPTTSASGDINLFIHGHRTTDIGGIYFTADHEEKNTEAIIKTDVDGSFVEVVRSRDGARELKVDKYGQHIYFIRHDGSSRRVRRINIDGSDPTLLGTLGTFDVSAIEVDSQQSQKIFIGDSTNNVIKSYNLDLTGVTTILSSPSGNVNDLDIDIDNQKLYAASNFNTAGDTSGAIVRCNLDGSSPEIVYTPGTAASGMLGVAVDTKRQFVYGMFFATIAGDIDIVRVELDGSNPVTITDSIPQGQTTNDLAIDTFLNKLFYVNPSFIGLEGVYKVDIETGDITRIIQNGDFGALQRYYNVDVLEPDAIGLFIKGQPSGDIDLYIGGHESASGDIDLVIKGKPSGDLDLYIGGHESASGDIDLFIKGKPSGDIDLYIGGKESASGDIDLFIQGKPSGDIDLYIGGKESASGDIDLFIQGKPSGDLDLYISGTGAVSGASGDINLFIKGTPSGDIPLFIEGEGSASGDIDLFVKGKPSGQIDLYIGGVSGVSGDIDLFIKGKPSGQIDLYIGGSSGVSGDLDLFIGGISGISGDITLVIVGDQSASGDIDLFIKGKPSGDLDLIIVGHSGVSGGLDLYISGPSGSSGSLDLVITGSGIIPFSGDLDLFIHGVVPKPELVCPEPSPDDAFQIADELIDIYQDRIDALINQIGKNIILEFDPIQEQCPNCHFDSQRNRSSGRPKSGGPRPFVRGRQCPYCKGRGFVETPREKCIKALVKWNPKDLATYRISIRGRKAVVRLKTLLTDAVHLERANTVVVDPDQSSMVIFRVKKIKGPVMRGLREDRYAVSFWELL